MPIIDDERGVLVLRLVYDGPPFSGKTTTLRTLARGLGVDVVTPEEREGRTVFFDWVDYVGGLFDGRRIRCQIVSVPGQRELASRREHLLETALSYARRMTSYTADGLRATKHVLWQNVEAPHLEAALALEINAQMRLSQSPEVTAYMNAYRTATTGTKPAG